MLSFAYGIIVSIYNVNKMKIIGNGFFLMMQLVLIGFLSLSFITESDLTIKLLIVLSIIFSSINIYCLYSKSTFINKYKSKIMYGSILLIMVPITFCLVLVVNNTKDIENEILELVRYLSGSLLLGCTLTAMLLGHWYLVQPGLNRSPIKVLCKLCIYIQIFVCLGWLLKPSMLQVFSGTIDDGWNGMLANMWLGASLTSIVILFMARKALTERSYSAVMATTGLLYLVILLVAGIELIPRSIFS